MIKPRILLVDDEEIVRDSVSEWLKSNNYDVEYACDGYEAIEKFRNSRFDTAVVDLKMPDIDGLAVTRQIKNFAPQTVVIIITAYGTIENVVEAMKIGVSDYLQKPFDPEELINVIEKNTVPAKRIETDSQNSVPDFQSLPQVSKDAGNAVITKKARTFFNHSFILGVLTGIAIASGIALAAYSIMPSISDSVRHPVVSAEIIAPDRSDNPVSAGGVDYYKGLYPHLAASLDLYAQVDNLQQEYLDKIDLAMEISEQEINRRIAQGIFLLKGNDFLINQQLFRELKGCMQKVLSKYSPSKSSSEIEEAASFYALSPFYQKEAVRFQGKVDENAWQKGICPICGTPPLMGKLSGGNGKLILHCPLCRTDWRFPRVTCPFCENTDQNTLKYFYADNNKAYRINVCEQCKRYLKVVDERIADKGTVLQIENIITGYLDVTAKNEGYQAIGLGNSLK